jgi:hypothetical protein
LLKSVLLASICGFAMVSHGQEPQVRKEAEKKTVDTEKSQPSTPKPIERSDPAAEMLQQAYYLGGQLPTDEHAYQLSEVVLIASRSHHPLLSQWVQELMQLTAGLPQGEMRQYAEQLALNALAEAKPAEALQMLSQLSPAIRSGDKNGTVEDDVRADAARTIFPKYWKSAQNPDLDAVRSVANYLGETGQYPFAAAAVILKQIGTPETAEILFFDALRYYGREQNNNIFVHIEFREFLESSYTSVPAAMARNGVELAVDRLLSEAAKPMPDDVVYVGRVYTGDGFLEIHSMAGNFLYELLPLVRKVEPELERRILEKVPALTIRVPNDLGSLPEDYGEAAILKINPGDPEARAKAVASATDGNRAAGARRLARTDPDAALRVADTILSPGLRSVTLLAIAQGKMKETDPERAAAIIREVGATAEKQTSIDRQQDPAIGQTGKAKNDTAKLGGLLTLARAQAGDESAELWSTLNQGLNLAEEMFDASIQAEPPRVGYSRRIDWEGPEYNAPGFSEANALIRIGMQKARANSLGWLAQEHDPRLKSYLLITAAEAITGQQRP